VYDGRDYDNAASVSGGWRSDSAAPGRVHPRVRQSRARPAHGVGNRWPVRAQRRQTWPDRRDHRSHGADNAFVAMDYTLDWLYAATQWCLHSEVAKPHRPTPWPGGDALAASSEDIDLLIAWADDHGPHVILMEAKGFTGWRNGQMMHKVQRLSAIFADNLAEQFDAHFLLVGPAASAGLQSAAAHDASTATKASPPPGPGESTAPADRPATGTSSAHQSDSHRLCRVDRRDVRRARRHRQIRSGAPAGSHPAPSRRPRPTRPRCPA
jgi:hypothetical protein